MGASKSELPPNHHAHYRQFSGPFGSVAGLTMTVGRGRDARLAAELAGVAARDSVEHVLDIGCGPGTAVRIAARHGGRATGVDPAEPMLRLARLITRARAGLSTSARRRSSGEIDWVCAGAEDLTLPDDSVSVCWSIASVHHWPDLDGGLAEVRRVLRSPGTFVALEKRSSPDASGLASHGWTAGQADDFAAMLLDHGFASAEVSNHDLGRRKVVAVTARR